MAYAQIAGQPAATSWIREARVYHGVRRWFSELGVVCRNYPARLALGAALDFSEAGGYYGLFALIPLAVIPALNLSFAGTPVFYIVGSVGALIGALVAAWLIECRGRKVTVTGFYIASALIIGLMSFTLGLGSMLTLLIFVLASAATTGSWVAAYPLFSEIFPTRSRASGIGASVAIGRIAAGLSPPLLVFIAGRYSAGDALLVAASFYLIGIAAMMPWISLGPESRGVTLESLAGPE
jgi:MFS family permease